MDGQPSAKGHRPVCFRRRSERSQGDQARNHEVTRWQCTQFPNRCRRLAQRVVRKRRGWSLLSVYSGSCSGYVGTSPIYTVQALFNPGDSHPVPISTQNVYDSVSLIFWSMMIIITLTYVTLVMRADNNGECGFAR
jgi:K+ potassium transporter integral membrane domain